MVNANNGEMKVIKLIHVLLIGGVLMGGVVASFSTLRVRVDSNCERIMIAERRTEEVSRQAHVNDKAIGQINVQLGNIAESVMEQKTILKEIRDRM